MPDLIRLLLSVPSAVELVREVEDETAFRADVPVAVNHSMGHDDQPGGGLSRDELHAVIEGRRGGPVVPEDDQEIRWAEKAEAVSLFDVLMRAACDTGQRHRGIHHRRHRLASHLILAMEFHQPAARVVVGGKCSDDHIPDWKVDKLPGGRALDGGIQGGTRLDGKGMKNGSTADKRIFRGNGDLRKGGKSHVDSELAMLQMPVSILPRQAGRIVFPANFGASRVVMAWRSPN